MKTPNEVHKKSQREYSRRGSEWAYPKDYRTKQVTVNGGLRFGHDGFIMVTTALAHKDVGLEPVDDGVWVVYYRHVPLGVLSERTKRVYGLEEYQL